MCEAAGVDDVDRCEELFCEHEACAEVDGIAEGMEKGIQGCWATEGEGRGEGGRLEVRWEVVDEAITALGRVVEVTTTGEEAEFGGLVGGGQELGESVDAVFEVRARAVGDEVGGEFDQDQALGVV